MLKIRRSLLFFVFLWILSLPSATYAENLDDNPLIPLIDGEKNNWKLELSGMYPKATESSTYHRRRLRDDNLPHDFKIYVENTGAPEKSYLYIFVGEFNKPSSVWTVEFNGYRMAESEHTNSIGGSIIGDGELDLERQTIMFDVTGMVKSGENILTIVDVDSPTISYNFDGAIIINFYPSDEEHQFFLYHGVEYLEKKDLNDAVLSLNLKTIQDYKDSEATLYTIYQNDEKEHDALYFNENLLKDKDASYILDGSHLIAKSFVVSESLESSNTITFTMERFQKNEGAPFIQYTDNPIYPSLAILDLKLPPKQKVVVLANSIDYNLASDFFNHLENKGVDVIPTSAESFADYKDHRFIIILGGPDAPEGVGNIVKESGILSIDDVDFIREKGNKRRFVKTNPWGLQDDQIVWVIAGSNREFTKSAHVEEGLRSALVEEVDRVRRESQDPVDLNIDPCPPLQSNLLNHTMSFASAESRGEVYICDVIYSDGEENWRIRLFNQGEEEVDLARYKIYNRNDRYYQFSPYADNIVKSDGYLTLYSAEISGSSLKRLGFARESLTLTDALDEILDKVEWDLVT
jgi:hypothetical protein